jgi:hypothetical protein
MYLSLERGDETFILVLWVLAFFVPLLLFLEDSLKPFVLGLQ